MSTTGTDPRQSRDSSTESDATRPRCRCRGLVARVGDMASLDGERALHAGFAMTWHVAVEGVRAGGRRDGGRPGLTRLHLDLDVELVDDERVERGALVRELDVG